MFMTAMSRLMSKMKRETSSLGLFRAIFGSVAMTEKIYFKSKKRSDVGFTRHREMALPLLVRPTRMCQHQQQNSAPLDNPQFHAVKGISNTNFDWVKRV